MLHGLNSELNNLILGHVIREVLVFFELFFQVVDGLLLLDAAGDCPVAEEVSGWV